MDKHVTIELEEAEAPKTQQKALLAKIVGMGSSKHPTDIARDKDKLIGEAVWQEYLREVKYQLEETKQK